MSLLYDWKEEESREECKDKACIYSENKHMTKRNTAADIFPTNSTMDFTI